MVSLVALIA